MINKEENIKTNTNSLFMKRMKALLMLYFRV